MQGFYQMRIWCVLVCVFALSVVGFSQTKKSAAKKSTGAAGVDKAYLQKIWDGWDALDATKQAEFYAKGKHLFFDIAPLKYSSWEEYETGVAKELADYKGGTFTVNDDAEVHPSGEYTWAAATIKSDMEKKNGKRELSTFRWTAVFQKQGGKWLIVHEHVSAPMQ
ncbi:MAG TPA: nuclear transport factor 2 family protein [Terriglobales bacterium]|nr:nuclear transport factor 2 family protein [Terriglobales bacterium]